MNDPYDNCMAACDACAHACDACTAACLAERDAQALADIALDIECAAVPLRVRCDGAPQRAHAQRLRAVRRHATCVRRNASGMHTIIAAAARRVHARRCVARWLEHEHGGHGVRTRRATRCSSASSTAISTGFTRCSSKPARAVRLHPPRWHSDSATQVVAQCVDGAQFVQEREAVDVGHREVEDHQLRA